MNTYRSCLWLFFLFLGTLVGIPGCNEFGLIQVTGRGMMPSAHKAYDGPVSNATFRFNATSCSGTVEGDFHYQDKYFPFMLNGKSVQDGVAIDGVATEAIECIGRDSGYYLCEACKKSFSFSTPFYAIEVEYQSGNPFALGEGFANICVMEKGEGVGAASAYQIAIRVESGPFSDYTNNREAKGKIQSHLCR